MKNINFTNMNNICNYDVFSTKIILPIKRVSIIVALILAKILHNMNLLFTSAKFVLLSLLIHSLILVFSFLLNTFSNHFRLTLHFMYLLIWNAEPDIIYGLIFVILLSIKIPR